MLTQVPTPQLVKEWKRIYKKYKPLLTPNRKSGEELQKFLETHYSAIPLDTYESQQIIIDNIMNNHVYKEKLPLNAVPNPRTYHIENNQVFVGIDLVTGYFLVEGSIEIYDQLFAYRGLDEKDLDNYFLVAEYINCTNELSNLGEE